MLRMVLACILLMSTVAVGQEAMMYGSGDLVGKRFELKKVNGKELETRIPAYVEWTTSTHMSGRICNVFQTSCTFLNSLLKTEPVASSRMRCPDQELGQLENKLFKYLGYGVTFTIAGDRLEMRRDDVVLEFEYSGPAGAKPPRPAPPAPVAGAKPSPMVPKSADGVTEKDLIGRSFVLTMVDGEKFEPQKMKNRQPTIAFGEDFRVSGSACNSFSGHGELKDGKLVMERAASTMMMCIDPALSKFEVDFHRVMREGVELSLDGSTLRLIGRDTVLEYEEEKK